MVLTVQVGDNGAGGTNRPVDKGDGIAGGKTSQTVVVNHLPNLVVFDSFHGLTAGRAAGAKVIGLATTNSAEAIAPLCDLVIDNFKSLSINDLHKMPAVI